PEGSEKCRRVQVLPRSDDDTTDILDDSIEQWAIGPEHRALPNDVGVVRHHEGYPAATAEVGQIPGGVRKMKVDEVGRQPPKLGAHGGAEGRRNVAAELRRPNDLHVTDPLFDPPQ